MINSQIENVKPMSTKERNKYGRKIVDLSDVFYFPEHKPTNLSFTPPRCIKCDYISYWDTQDNICEECFNSSETLEVIKDELQLRLDDMQATIDDLSCTLEELAELKHNYHLRAATKQNKLDIIVKMFSLLD